MRASRIAIAVAIVLSVGARAWYQRQFSQIAKIKAFRSQVTTLFRDPASAQFRHDEIRDYAGTTVAR